MAEIQSTVEYREIPGFPGYLASSDGTIWTKMKTCARKSPKGDKVLYRGVRLTKSGEAYWCLVHRLILQTFVGPCPDGLECCHNDGNAENNHVSNLRWDTKSANHDDQRRHGTMLVGVDCHASRLTEDQVRSIRREYGPGMGFEKLAKKYGVVMSTIRKIIRGKTWKHLL